ncbi:hypothetical protein PG984_011463 [Apiospora sp. TS-2023a]
MADNSDKSTKRVTRAAAAPSGTQTNAAPGSGNTAASPAPLTSGDLNHRPMRVWQRRQRVNAIVKEQLQETAFVFLDDEDTKQQILATIDKCLTDDIRPRALYPYAQRAHATIMTVFRDNLGLFKGIGAEGTNEDGEFVDCFGDVLDEPVLEELFYKEEDFYQSMAAPEEDNAAETEDGKQKDCEMKDAEMEGTPASNKD